MVLHATSTVCAYLQLHTYRLSGQALRAFKARPQEIPYDSPKINIKWPIAHLIFSISMSSMTDFLPASPEAIAHNIKQAYHLYRNTTDPDRQGLFFSPSCMQICHPIPSYTATSREEIVQYVKDAGQKSAKGKGKGVYTIRPLHASEFEFSTNEITAPIGFTPEELKQKAVQESWIGMRVDLWDEGDEEDGLLVKVQYWWRFEANPEHERVMMGEEQAMGWRQCLHDIVYLGLKDGTEGEDGLVVLERSS
jgi:hypothetical protein